MESVGVDKTPELLGLCLTRALGDVREVGLDRSLIAGDRGGPDAIGPGVDVGTLFGGDRLLVEGCLGVEPGCRDAGGNRCDCNRRSAILML